MESKLRGGPGSPSSRTALDRNLFSKRSRSKRRSRRHTYHECLLAYVPYSFASGSWDEYREQAKNLALEALARFCSNIPAAVIAAEALGPPDIEKKTGLRGGHIFQGECLPPYMWDQRLPYQTPMKGVYLCGACTHPGGSVIAINGRNAAMAVLRDFSFSVSV